MKALVVEVNETISDVIGFTLRREGFEVEQVYNGEAALRRWAEIQPDLVVLAVNIPGVDGFTVCQRIREQADTPIIMLNASPEENGIVHGLDLGADDYLVKPFSPRLLIARAQAVLRRAGKRPTRASRRVGRLVLEPKRRELHLGECDSVTLTRLENRLMDYLMLYGGTVLSAETIINQVWGAEGGDQDMLRQLIYRVRGKLGQACEKADVCVDKYFIENIPGLGYGLHVPDEG